MARRLSLWIETIFSPATTLAKNNQEFEHLRRQAVELERDNLKAELKRVNTEIRKEHKDDVKRLTDSHRLELERFRTREEHLLNMVVVAKGGEPLPEPDTPDAENNDLQDQLKPTADVEELLRVRAQHILIYSDGIEDPTKEDIETQYQKMLNDDRGIEYWLNSQT